MKNKKGRNGCPTDKKDGSRLQPKHGGGPSRAGQRRLLIPLAVALAVVVLALFWQTGQHEFLNYDDDLYVTANPHVSTGLTVPNIFWAFKSIDVANWHPVTWLSHQADAQIYGLEPRGHHLTSVIIHTLTTLLILLLLFRLTCSVWQSAFVAALFALHPLHVESVAWVAERKDLLSAFFWFITLLLYARYTKKRRLSLYLLSLFSFILGLMSKPMVVTLPAVMLLLDVWPLNRCDLTNLEKREWFKTCVSLLKEKIPFFVCSLLSSIITVYAQQKGEAVNTLHAVPIVLRLENAVAAYGKYLANAFWPHDMAVLYPLPSSIPAWQVICSLVVLVAVSAATARVWRRHPYLLVGWGWFLVTLLPVIGLVQVGSQSMADRYTYIPLVGIFVMVAWGVPALIRDHPLKRPVCAGLAAVVVAASVGVTWRQIGYWRDNLSLYEHTLGVTADNYLIHNNLGNALAEKGETDAAIREYQRAVAIDPNYFEAYSNLGVALADKGYLEAAIGEYQKALTLNPKYAEAHNNLGIALVNRGALDEAIAEYRTALAINQDYAEAHNNLGVVLARKGELDSAIKEYRMALTLRPGYAEAHNNLGNALAKKGDLDGAIGEFQRALTIRPDYARAQSNLANIREQKGRDGETKR